MGYILISWDLQALIPRNVECVRIIEFVIILKKNYFTNIMTNWPEISGILCLLLSPFPHPQSPIICTVLHLFPQSHLYPLSVRFLLYFLSSMVFLWPSVSLYLQSFSPSPAPGLLTHWVSLNMS